MNSKVAIIGCNENREEAPFDEKGWDFWGVNCLSIYMPNKPYTKWFDLHKFTVRPDGQWFRKGSPVFMGININNYLDELNSLDIPVYMIRETPAVVRSIAYPQEEILRRFRPFFTCSISWMIALAIFSGYSTIGIYGLDMNAESEYAWQKPSVTYFLGVAEGLGIKVLTASNSGVFKSDTLYGYEQTIK